MGMGIFQGLDVASASDNPFGVPDGTYYATVTAAGVKNSDKVGDGLTFDFTIRDCDDEKYNGRKISEWLTIPVPNDAGELNDKGQMQLSFLKGRLASLDVPESEMNTVDPEDLIGLEIVVILKTTSKNGNDYQNIKKMTLDNGDHDPDENPFA